MIEEEPVDHFSLRGAKVQLEVRVWDFLIKTQILGRGEEVQVVPHLGGMAIISGRCAGIGPDPSSSVINRRDPHVNLTEESTWSNVPKESMVPQREFEWDAECGTIFQPFCTSSAHLFSQWAFSSSLARSSGS